MGKKETNLVVEQVSDWLAVQLAENDDCAEALVALEAPADSSVNEWSYKDDGSSANKAKKFLKKWVSEKNGADASLVKAFQEKAKSNADVVRNVLMNACAASTDDTIRTQYVNLSYPAGSKTKAKRHCPLDDDAGLMLPNGTGRCNWSVSPTRPGERFKSECRTRKSAKQRGNPRPSRSRRRAKSARSVRRKRRQK
jgi:hypothetical protein